MSFKNQSTEELDSSESDVPYDSSDDIGNTRDKKQKKQLILPSWFYEMPIALKKFMIFARESNSDDHIFWADNGNRTVRETRIKLKELYGRLKKAIPTGNKDAITEIRKTIDAKEEYFFSYCVRKVEIDETIPETRPMPRAYRLALYDDKKSLLIFKKVTCPEQRFMLQRLRHLKKRYNAMVRIGNKFAPHVGNELYHKEFLYRHQFLTLLNPDGEHKEIEDEVIREQKRIKLLKKKPTLDLINKKQNPRKKMDKKGEGMKIGKFKKGGPRRVDYSKVSYSTVPPPGYKFKQQTGASSSNVHSNPPSHGTLSHEDQASSSYGQTFNNSNDNYNQLENYYFNKPGENEGFHQPRIDVHNQLDGNNGFSKSENGNYNQYDGKNSFFQAGIGGYSYNQYDGNNSCTQPRNDNYNQPQNFGFNLPRNDGYNLPRNDGYNQLGDDVINKSRNEAYNQANSTSYMYSNAYKSSQSGQNLQSSYNSDSTNKSGRWDQPRSGSTSRWEHPSQVALGSFKSRWDHSQPTPSSTHISRWDPHTQSPLSSSRKIQNPYEQHDSYKQAHKKPRYSSQDSSQYYQSSKTKSKN